MRDIKNDLQIPFGIAAPNPISSTDFYYGTFDTIDDAYANVPATLREVGRQFAVYKSGNKTNRQDGEVIVYTWALAAGQWKHVRVSGEPLPDGADGQIYEIDNASPQKVKPTDRLYHVEKKATDNTEAIKYKLDKPTVTGNTTNYPFVVGVNNENVPAKLPAGDLGKNIANSNLTTIAGSGLTQATPYTWNAAGYPLMIKGLPDKSNDITFDRVKVQNAEGVEAVASNIYNILYKGLTGLTAQQATNISFLLNGGIGSDGPMSVNNISPPIVQNRYDSIEYVLLRGLNLNLSAVGRKIEILAADKSTVVVTIPDNQIQTLLNGQELIFYYNFYNFPVGTYYIRITSGVKQYITDLDISIVELVNNIDILNITWNINYVGIPPNPKDYASGESFSLNMPIGKTVTPVLNVKSSTLFEEGDDFYIELNLIFPARGYSPQDMNKSFFGIGYSSSENNANINTLVAVEYNFRNGDNNIGLFNNGLWIKGNDGYGNIKPPVELNVVFIKTGNLFRTITEGVTSTKILTNNSGYSLFFNILGRDADQNVNGKILKAFKFN